MKARISEVFASIQGEGKWVGVPSAFVRLSGCNMRCVWCDTPYASWYPEGPVRETAQVADEISSLRVKHVVVTGGEPMLFDATVELCEILHNREHIITIETAGTVYKELQSDLMSISPKLSNSMDPARLPEDIRDQGWVERHEETRLNREPLKQLAGAYDCQYKFVVNPDSDLAIQIAEIEEILSMLPVSHRLNEVILMPEGIDSETIHRRAKLLVAICMEKGYRLGSRLHVDLFGDTRGT